MRYILIFLLLLSVGAKAQVFQTNNSPYKFRGVIGDSIMKIPAATDTPTMANPKWGAGINGALFLRLTDTTLWAKVGPRWELIAGGGRLGGDTTIFEVVLDSTGQPQRRVLFSGSNNKISSSPKILIDSSNSKLVINNSNVSVGGSGVKLWVNGNATIGNFLSVNNLEQSADTTTYKPVVAPVGGGRLRQLNQWPGGGGSGSVEYVVSGVAIRVDSSGRAYTVNADTGRGNSQLITGATLNAVADSLGALGLVNDSVILNRQAKQPTKRFNIMSMRADSLIASTSSGLHIASNNGTDIAMLGAGGGGTFLTYGFSGYNSNIAANYTVRSFTDKNYVDSSITASGGGVSIDSVAIVNRTAVDQTKNIVSTNSGSGGGAQGTVNENFHNIFVGYRAGMGATATATASQNVVIGADAFRLDSTGSENVAIGKFAMEDAQGAIRNVAVGSGALTNITDGTQNTAMGFNAGLGITTGDNNLALGAGALDAITTGEQNVAVGTGALTALGTSGSLNTAVGYNALSSMTSSSTTGYSVGIGHSAGGSVTTATRVVHIGGLSGLSSTGSANVFIGYAAGRSVTGNNNVAIGGSDGNNAETMRGSGNALSVAVGSISMNYNNGSNNTFVGAESGRGASATPHTGQYNNGLGYRAGYDISGAITGASNTIIGDRISLPSITSSNQFVFGINGVNYLTRFTGGGWLINYTSSAVTTQTTSAAFEVNGTTGAVLFPRMTSTQRDALTGTNGMVIYNSTTDKLQVYAAGAWVDLH